VRLFVALDLPESFKAALLEAAADLRAAREDLRWTPADNIHLTLAFLGELDGKGAALAAEAARRTAEATAPFELSFGGLVAFPRRGAARILAAGMARGSRECAAAAARLEDELERVGAEAAYAFRERERRPFAAHATLARAGRLPARLSAQELDPAADASCRIGTLSVYESVLGRGGPCYRPLAAFPLVRNSSTKCSDRGIAR
jgi:2'-5' RNA ligase